MIMGITIVTTLVGILAGIVIGYLIQLSKINKMTADQSGITQKMVQLQTQFESEKVRSEQVLAAETAKSSAEQERKNLIESYERESKTIIENYEKQIRALNETHSLQILTMQKADEELKSNFAKISEDAARQTNERIRLMKSEFQSLAQEILENKSGNLQTANRDLIKAILDPLSNNIKEFKESFDSNKITATKAQIQFEDAIKQMREETMKIGNDAVNLTKALKGNSKTQGDWGEMILETMLEKSGLIRGENYTVQENFKTEDGKNKRPDVIVKFPENRCVIIDSKVSLTDYVRYVEAETEDDRQRYLKEHIASVRRHIDELARKEDYLSVVKNSIGVVLMFIPNESSYIAAVQNDSELLDYAAQKQIMVISPANLILTLKLANGLWQMEKQTKGVEDIVKQVTNMYEKYVNFTESFKDIGKAIDSAKAAYDNGFKQLSSGRGNLASQMENMCNKGLSPKKRQDRLFLDEYEK